jgi:alanine racemase
VTRIDRQLRSAGLPSLPRAAWLEIDTQALTGNLRACRSLVATGTHVAAVVKADGYGHGLEISARSFLQGGADLLCVAGLDEALALRTAGIAAPVLTLYPVPAAGLSDAARSGIEVSLTAGDAVDELVAAWNAGSGARPADRLRVHLEVETGLTRGGVAPDAAPAIAARLTRAAGIELAGLWSHLSAPGDAAFASAQSELLEQAARSLSATGVPDPPLHLVASGGLFAGTAPHHSMVRPGLALYGALPPALPVAPGALAAAAALRPAMRLVAMPLRVLDVPVGTPVGYGGTWRAERPSRIATLPVGYGDGYPRQLSPGASALVRGRRVPLVGVIAMDALAVDVTDVPGVGRADEFVLLGAQGDEQITVEELARLRTTIAWEVMTSMARRIPRVYHAPAGTVGMRTLTGEILAQDLRIPAATREGGVATASRVSVDR